jgi:hypothetical protein
MEMSDRLDSSGEHSESRAALAEAATGK